MTDGNSTLPQPAFPSEGHVRHGPPNGQEPRWQPLGAIDRRVVGVLAEKAKTTPDAYPMSLNAIRNACNQKSNRSPVMNLESEDVEESLDRLRDLGAVGMIEGHGRVRKYRHYLYEWLAVDKVELAVMAELLVRGTQTEGALRSRAARMEPIRDLAELRPVLGALKSRGLVIPLTPEGRGHVVTHALLLPSELEAIKSQYAQGPAARALLERQGTRDEGRAMRDEVSRGRKPSEGLEAPSAPAPPAPAIQTDVLEVLRREMDELRSQVAQLRSDVEELSDQQSRADDALRDFRDALGG